MWKGLLAVSHLTTDTGSVQNCFHQRSLAFVKATQANYRKLTGIEPSGLFPNQGLSATFRTFAMDISIQQLLRFRNIGWAMNAVPIARALASGSRCRYK